MRTGPGLCVQLIHPLQPLVSLRLSLSESLPRAGEGVGLGPQSSQPLPSSRLVAAPGPDSAGPTCGCGHDCPHMPPPPRPSSWSGPTSSRPSLDIHSWAPQFLSPATRAGVPPPRTELLNCACPENGLDLGFQAWGVAAAVSVRGRCQTGLRRPGPRPVWVWEGARRPATPVPPRALGWGFPSVLEPGQVSHFTLRQGAGHMGPGQPKSPPRLPACLPGLLPDGKNLREGARLGASSLGLGHWRGGSGWGGPPAQPSISLPSLAGPGAEGCPGLCGVGKVDVPNLSQSVPDHPQTPSHCLFNRVLKFHGSFFT